MLFTWAWFNNTCRSHKPLNVFVMCLSNKKPDLDYTDCSQHKVCHQRGVFTFLLYWGSRCLCSSLKWSYSLFSFWCAVIVYLTSPSQELPVTKAHQRKANYPYYSVVTTSHRFWCQTDSSSESITYSWMSLMFPLTQGNSGCWNSLWATSDAGFLNEIFF